MISPKTSSANLKLWGRICGYSETTRSALPPGQQIPTEAKSEGELPISAARIQSFFRIQAQKLNCRRSFYSFFFWVRRYEYLTPRVRLTPLDLRGTKLEKPTTLHFICSPERASGIIKEIHQTPDWTPVTIYEPIPVSVVTLSFADKTRNHAWQNTHKTTV